MGSDSDMNEGAPFDEYGLVSASRRLHAAIDQLDETAARAISVSRNDLRCINLLENGPRSPSELAEALGLTRGSMTTLLDRLETRDYVERVAHPTDRRGLLIKLKPKVFRELASVYKPVGSSLVALANEYGSAVTEVLAQQLETIAERYEHAAKRNDRKG